MIFEILNKKNSDNNADINLIKIVALLIHAAKIDEKYTNREKKIICSFVVMYTKSIEKNDKNSKTFDESEATSLIEKAEKYENNSNQILEYTQEVKKMSIDVKKIVIEFLWKIILSDDKSDVYESNLMRRICGLLYVPDKLSGEIKLSILEKQKK